MPSALILAVALASNAQWLGPKVAPAESLTRVITASPSVTETILALGAKDRLVGVSRFDEFEEVRTLPRIGGFTDISVEAVIALKPQLVVVQKSPGNQKPIETLAALGVPVLALPLSTLGDVSDMLQVLGDTLGTRAKADQLISEIAQTREAVRTRAAQRKNHPTGILVYGFAPLIVAGPGSFAAELLQDVGIDNLALKARTAYPVFSKEKLVAHAPALIIDASDVRDGRDGLLKLKPLAKTRWVTLPSKDLLHPGPALARGLLELESEVFGETKMTH